MAADLPPLSSPNSAKHSAQPKLGHNLALCIDHTLLRPEATPQQIRELCEQAQQYGFFAVCVQPSYVALCRSLLTGSRVRIASVCAFPHGALLPAQKAAEALMSVEQGADEIDMVLNLGALRSGNWDLLLEDISAVRAATEGRVLKVILETALLTDDEKRHACERAVQAGANFVKTSTGFGGGGASVADVRLMHEAVAGRAEVKASGGIRSLQDALALLQAGATRLGTSGGVALVQAQRQQLHEQQVYGQEEQA